MALDERYFISPPLDQYFVNKDTGLPLAGGTLEFYRDSSRITPHTVYQLSGEPPNYTYTALPNPITLSAVGTVENDSGDNVVIYLYPYDAEGNLDLYYVVAKDSDGNAQWTREAWPNITDANDPTQDLDVSNQISNPQFTRVFINEGISTTYEVSVATDEVFAFAPNWDFVISGTGTVVVERIAIAGNDNVVTNPPYVLDVTVSAGITACKLVQRFNTNSGLWASTDDQDIFLSGHLIARNVSAGDAEIQMLYAESSGGSPITILDGTFDNSGYVSLTGTTTEIIPPSTNPDVGEDGYVEIYLSFQASSHVRISSIQVVPTNSDVGGDIIKYDIQSSNREQSLLGDYYIPALEEKRIPSLITGWDFKLNPAQFGETGTITGSAGYIWDQTIAVRSATNITFARNSITGGLQLTSTGSNAAVTLIQYLSGKQAKELIGSRFSVNINAHKTSVGDDVTIRVYLCRGTAASSIPTLPTIIGSTSNDGVFILSQANWTEIPRSGLSTATGILPVVSSNTDLNSISDIKFNGWELTNTSDIGDTDKFSIVVTLHYPDTSTVMTIDSISVTPGNIPTRPALKTFDQVLRECEHYYEKTYNNGVYAGASTSQGSILVQQSTYYVAAGGGTSSRMFCSAFNIQYSTIKSSNQPNIHIYSLTGSQDSVTAYMKVNNTDYGPSQLDISNWSNVDRNEKSSQYTGNQSTRISDATIGDRNVDSYIRFHYVIDSRLGVV